MDKPILDIRNLSKNYGEFAALNNISFSIERGVIVGLLGKNGAGKTTMMKTILGLLCQYDGEIWFEGKLISHSDPKVMRKISSLVDVRFYEDMTAYENLNYLLMADSTLKSRARKDKISRLLEMVGLEGSRNDKIKSFSFGMKQRLALAQVFLHDAKLLILDEPFVGQVGDLADEIVAISDGMVKYGGTLDELQNANKKYHIWICGKKDEVTVPYRPEELQKVIHEYLDKGMDISRIEVVENALYQLFV